METWTPTAPLELVRLGRMVNAQETRPGAQVDPLRNLIRRRNEQISEILRRLKQVQDMQKGAEVGPAGRCLDWDSEHGASFGRPGEATTF